ncbi:Short chain aldehyde dehydrogenase 1 [Linum perenne]
MAKLQGKVALITGGARGIGAAAARLFSQHGAKVLIADIRSEIESESGQPVSYIHCDASRDADIQNAVDAAVSAHGKLDIMYSNAGIVGEKFDDPSSTDPEIFRRVFDVNVYGSFLAAKHAARVMRRKGGAILLTGSAAAVSQGICPHVYTASKHAVVGLMRNLCVELGGSGIRVNCISPSEVATPAALEVTGFGDAAEFEAAFAEAANLKGKVLKAEDVAAAALNLVSDECGYISGVNLVVDGGNCLKSA